MVTRTYVFQIFSRRKGDYLYLVTNHWPLGQNLVKNSQFTPNCSPDVSLVRWVKAGDKAEMQIWSQSDHFKSPPHFSNIGPSHGDLIISKYPPWDFRFHYLKVPTPPPNLEKLWDFRFHHLKVPTPPHPQLKRSLGFQSQSISSLPTPEIELLMENLTIAQTSLYTGRYHLVTI